MKNKGVEFGTTGTQAVDWYIEHGRKDVRGFRIRMNIILKDFGNLVADEIKPSDIDGWLKAHQDWAPATKHRYKNVFGETVFRSEIACFVWGDKTYAELCVVPASSLSKIPNGMDLVEAAALPLVTTTGYLLMTRALQFGAGQTLIVNGG